MQVSANVADTLAKGYILRSTSTSVKFPGYLLEYLPKRSSGLFSLLLQSVSKCYFQY